MKHFYLENRFLRTKVKSRLQNDSFDPFGVELEVVTRQFKALLRHAPRSRSSVFLFTWTCRAQPQSSARLLLRLAEVTAKRRWRLAGFHSGLPVDYKPTSAGPLRLSGNFLRKRLSSGSLADPWHVDPVPVSESPRGFFGGYFGPGVQGGHPACRASGSFAAIGCASCVLRSKQPQTSRAHFGLLRFPLSFHVMLFVARACRARPPDCWNC